MTKRKRATEGSAAVPSSQLDSGTAIKRQKKCGKQVGVPELAFTPPIDDVPKVKLKKGKVVLPQPICTPPDEHGHSSDGGDGSQLVQQNDFKRPISSAAYHQPAKRKHKRSIKNINMCAPNDTVQDTVPNAGQSTESNIAVLASQHRQKRRKQQGQSTQRVQSDGLPLDCTRRHTRNSSRNALDNSSTVSLDVTTDNDECIASMLQESAQFIQPSRSRRIHHLPHSVVGPAGQQAATAKSSKSRQIWPPPQPHEQGPADIQAAPHQPSTRHQIRTQPPRDNGSAGQRAAAIEPSVHLAPSTATAASPDADTCNKHSHLKAAKRRKKAPGGPPPTAQSSPPMRLVEQPSTTTAAAAATSAAAAAVCTPQPGSAPPRFPPTKRRVSFDRGPLDTADGHPVHEGWFVVPVRRRPLGRRAKRGPKPITKKGVKVLEELLGGECEASLVRLKRRAGLLPPRERVNLLNSP